MRNQTMLRGRVGTREKIEAVAKAKRWTLAMALDVAADGLLAAEGIKAPKAPADKPARKYRRRKAA